MTPYPREVPAEKMATLFDSAHQKLEKAREVFFGLVENACGGVPPALVSAGLLEEKQYRKGPTTTTLSQVN